MTLRPLFVTLALLFGGAGHAQTTVSGDIAAAQTSVLTVDVEALFSGSLFSATFDAQYQQKAEALLAENLKIETALTEEEKSLTARRPTMTPEAFRAEAEAFSTKVDAIRAAQDTKEAELRASVSEAEQRFIEAVSPILGQMMAERGAVVILDRRTVFLTRSVADITQEAIERINAELGDGAALLDAAQ